jgi:hypothetical protein
MAEILYTDKADTGKASVGWAEQREAQQVLTNVGQRFAFA